MIYNIPFLVDEVGGAEISEDMELAAAFLYFSSIEPEKIMGIFPKQDGERIGFIARGYYPLYGYFLENEGRFCIYDRLCGVSEEMKVENNPAAVVDFESLLKLCIDERIKAVKGAVSDIKTKMWGSMPVGRLLHGYKNLQDILKVRNSDSLSGSTVSLDGYISKEEPDNSQVEAVLNRLRLFIDSEIDIYKKLCDFDDGSFKSMVNEKHNIYDGFEELIDRTERETGQNIGKLFIDREEKIREAQRLYGRREEELNGEYLLCRNRYDIAVITDCKVEADICRNDISDLEKETDKLKRDMKNEFKDIDDHYEGLVQEQKNILRQVIKDRDDGISRCENKYNELHQAVEGLKKSIMDDICDKNDRIAQIKDSLLEFSPESGCRSIIINIPFYIAELNGRNVRYKLLFPVSVRGKNQVKSIISGMTKKVSLPYETRDRLFEDLEERLARWLLHPTNDEVYSMFRQRDMISSEGMHDTAENGLSKMFTLDILNDKNFDRALISIRTIFSGR